jgi:hypothetical protein
MTRTQWRRYQRSKKGIVAKANDKTVNPKEKLVETVIRPVKERLFFLPVEGNAAGDDEMDSEFRLHGFRTRFRRYMQCGFYFTRNI